MERQRWKGDATLKDENGTAFGESRRCEITWRTTDAETVPHRSLADPDGIRWIPAKTLIDSIVVKWRDDDEKQRALGRQFMLHLHDEERRRVHMTVQADGSATADGTFLKNEGE